MKNSNNPDIERLSRLSVALDSRFRIPGTGIGFGYDTLLGLIPGIGDFAALGPAAYIIWQGKRAGASNSALARMTLNSGVDFLVGTIPVIGDIFDVSFRSNRRNVALLKRDLGLDQDA